MWGLTRTFLTYRSKILKKIFENVDFWLKCGQNQSIDVPMGLKTNFNQIST